MSCFEDTLLPHSIKWDLFAAGVELTDLKAIAAWEHGSIRKLGKADKKKNRWTDKGTLFAKAVMP